MAAESNINLKITALTGQFDKAMKDVDRLMKKNALGHLLSPLEQCLVCGFVIIHIRPAEIPVGQRDK